MNGADTPNATGVYGTLGVSAPTNVPTSRLGPAGWTDPGGNLWLFGGQVPQSTGDSDFINDLWQFDIASNQWTWVNGSSSVNASGDYGTLGVALASNVPGARSGATGWTDSNGNFWLFGGLGVDSKGNYGYLNDLWEFTPTSKQWSWVGGTSLGNAVGNYGTQGVTNSSNVPAGRYFAAGWIDSADDLWLFGGWAQSGPAAGVINDLWEFDSKTREWTWISGSEALLAGAVYGSQGISAASNVPGARQGSVGWRDANGNLWLFGGSGYAANGDGGWLNDLWEFSPKTNQWTWMNGGNTADSIGSYGTQGVANASSGPGSRVFAVSWTDSSNNFWLFGGWAFSPTGIGIINDLWQFNPGTGQWTWMSGSESVLASGVYGTLGTSSASNVPGARQATVTWRDTSGNLWLFGGDASNTNGIGGDDSVLNDLWRWTPASL